MKIAAIISEYNPFHNGHKYHIEQTHNLGATHVVAIMSGNFVQRGSASIFSKHIRAKMALLNGVDLVLELPTIWSTASAEKFAFGGVYIANALSCVDFLSFGSECGDINLLKSVSIELESYKFKDNLKNNLKSGISFAAAVELSLKSSSSNNISKLILSPNNLLASNYIHAINKLKSKIKPITIKRNKCTHDSTKIMQNFASASLIRKNILLNKISIINNIVPNNVKNIINEEILKGNGPADLLNAERAILLKLRSMSKEDIKCLPNINEGLENRIYNCIQSCTSLNNIYDTIKTKRYSHSRIRRTILHAILNITSDMYNMDIPYIKVLGFNNKGKEILNLAKKTSSLPIITKYSDINAAQSDVKTLFEFESAITDIYNMLTPSIQPCSKEMTNKILII